MPRTAWELRDLVRPLAVRRTPRRQPYCPRPFDPALVEFIYDSRFALIGQLQRRFPEWLPTLRTAQRHAARLIAAGYVATAPVRSTGPHFPAVLYATGRGIGLIRRTYAQHGIDWDGAVTEERKARGLALDSVLHEVLLTEFDLAVYRTVEARPDLRLRARERRYFRRQQRLSYTDRGRRRHLIPDGGFLPAIKSGRHERLLPLHLIELENGTHSITKLRRKLQAYAAWAETASADWLGRHYASHGESQRRPEFRLLLIAHDKYGTVPDERRLLDLLVESLALPRRMRNRIWLTTAGDLHRHQADPAPLDADVWIRARDARSWLPEFWQFSEPRGSEHPLSLNRRRRTFVAERLADLPRHPLFPQPE